MRARSLSSVAVGLLLLVACTDDAATTGPSMLKEGFGRPGRVDLPGTANSTLEWLGEPAGCYGGTPTGINASGLTVGYCFGSGVRSTLGVVYDPARLVRDRTIPDAYEASSFFAVNDAGVATGAGACICPGGLGYGLKFNSIGDPQSWVFLADVSPTGPFSSEGRDINNHGDVVGELFELGPSATPRTGIWPATGGVIDLGPSKWEATAIAPNLTGAQMIVVGSDFLPTGGWIYQNGVKSPLPEIGDPWDVADNGWVVGADGTNCGNPSYCAVLLRNGVRMDLSPLCRADDQSGLQNNSLAKALAFMGTNPMRTIVVGECASLPYVWYDNGAGIFDGEFLPVYPGDDFGIANDLNASGQIVGYTTIIGTNVHHSLRWTFTPPPINTAPTANVGGPYTGNEGSAVAFNGAGSSDPENDALTYAWDFGDGSTGTGATSSHSYADNGSYTVTLTVNDGSLSNTATTTATIANVAPSGVPSAPTTIGIGVPFLISIAATDPGSVDAGSLQYRFNCGTGWGPITTTPSTTCTLAAVGTYTLRFSVRDKDLATVLYQRTITATSANMAPVVTLTSPGTVTIPVGGSVTVTGTFTDAAGDNPWAGRMFWGAGQPATSLGSVTPGQPLSATRTFTTPGVYAARLEVRDKFNATGRANVTITVQ